MSRSRPPRLPERITPRVRGLLATCPRDHDASKWKSPYAGAEAFHETWLAHEGDPYVIRLARAQAAHRSSVSPRLTPSQLVVGTPPPRATVTYGAGPFEWDFRIDEELLAERPALNAIAEYWRSFLKERDRPGQPAQLSQADYGSTVWLSQLGCHSTQDFTMAIDGGIDGLRAALERARPNHPASASWYQGVGITLDGVARYIAAHAEALDRGASDSGVGPEQRSEWARLAAGVHHLAGGGAPRNFLEAAQLFWFLFMLNGHDSPGAIDRHIAAALERDLTSGELAIEQAQEQVDCLFIKLTEHLCFGATIGGLLPDGTDSTSSATWLCLNSISRLRLLSPRTAIRYHRNMPPELFSAAVDSLVSGATYPSIVNDEIVTDALIRRGVSPEHARDYTFCGCGQVIPSGRAYGSFEDIILNAAKPLTLALNRGRDEITHELTGVETEELSEFTTFADFERAVWQQLTHVLSLGIEADTAAKRWSVDHLPEFLRSALTHSCVERGLDWRAGGAEYHLGMTDAVGMANLTDSLLAVKEIVYERRRVTLGELSRILASNWADHERLRLECSNGVHKFGNGWPDADGMYAKWMGRLNEWLMEQRTLWGGPWGIDIVGWTGAVTLGEGTGATPDGRRLGESLADSGGPSQGRDTEGVTTMLNSVASLPLRGTHGPVALNLRFNSSLVARDKGRKALEDLLRTYLELGGMHAQVSMASGEVMRAAKAEPEKHRDLMVRVGGFSAYFVELDPRWQDDMIRRTEHTLG